MMFNKQTQKAVVLTPKCASVSIKYFLASFDFRLVAHSSLPNHHHVKHEDAVRLYPNLNKYQMYGVFRNPLERFLSTLKFLNLQYDKFFSYFDKPRSQNHLFFKSRQVEWLDIPNIRLIDFSKLEEGILRLVEGLNGSGNLAHLHKSKPIKIAATDELKAFVRDYYAADYQFARDVLGKEY